MHSESTNPSGHVRVSDRDNHEMLVHYVLPTNLQLLAEQIENVMSAIERKAGRPDAVW